MISFLGRESSRDSGVDLDSPSVASNYTERKKENKKPEKQKTFPPTGVKTEQTGKPALAKFKFSKAQGFDLRRAIQQKVIYQIF